ncbi:MAG: 4-hydroxythreonine-4-phosphate dehydrogenase PdxA [Planctomycetota bacterium]
MPNPNQSTDPRQRIAVTTGDPAGVGPEVIAAVWADRRVTEVARPVVVGEPDVMRKAVALRSPGVAVRAVGRFDEGIAAASPSVLPCWHPEGATHPGDFTPGDVTAATGQSAYEAVVAATRLALAGDCDALVTAPISKAALHAAGHDYPGHTELLAELCDAREFAMMLYLPQPAAPATRAGVGVVHVTLHCALRDAIDRLSPDAVVEKCRLAHDAMAAFGLESPRIGVAALNPHAGEGGLFGDEESRVIAPGVERARATGVDATGPHSVDTLMGRAAVLGEFDAVVAMYHDQGHIALKLLGMHSAVNVTLGLPIVRTSVAHGTAPDLAWKGVAETGGMIAAIESAATLARVRAAARG